MATDTGAFSLPLPTRVAENAQQVLSGIRVLDLSRWVAGEFATKVFADFGADVIKIEKPGEGSLTRHWGPFPDDVPDPEQSAMFLHLNTNKRSVNLDLHSEAGRQAILELCRTVDLVVESFRPGHLEQLGLGWDALREVNPQIVLTRISAFGQSGPYAGYEATGLTLQAMGGPMNSTGGPGRSPLQKPRQSAHCTIGRFAAEASLAGIMSAWRTGAGCVIDVPGFEVLLSGADRRASFILAASYSGTDAPRGVRSAHRGGVKVTGPFSCRDGFVMLYLTTPTFWNRMLDMIAADDPEFRETFLNRVELDDEDWNRYYAYLRTWFLEHDKVAIMEEAERRRIPLTAFLEIGEVFHHEHFRSRGAFVRADHPAAGSLEYVGAPWRMDRGWQLRHTAPLQGADSSAVLGQLGMPEGVA